MQEVLMRKKLSLLSWMTLFLSCYKDIIVNIPSLHMAPSKVENGNYVHAQQFNEVGHESKVDGNKDDGKIETASMLIRRSDPSIISLFTCEAWYFLFLILMDSNILVAFRCPAIELSTLSITVYEQHIIT